MSAEETEPMSITGAVWRPAADAPDAGATVAARFGLGAAAARVLAARFPTVPEALEASFDAFHDPWAMRNMGAAVERLLRAVRDGEHVRVVTDYDVDGTTSSLILQAALKIAAGDRAGAPLSYHIPHRFLEGYGFSVAAADKAAEDRVSLVVTADIGVRDFAAVTRARERGLDVLICDHHLPAGATVPADATVLCPPQPGCTYPNPSLAACGISLKVAQALLAKHPRRDEVVRSLLKLAAIGTVADLVPLTTPENRAIVALGLQELNRGRHSVGLQALLTKAGLQAGQIRETDLGYRVGPRINAAGRVADARLVVELLHERDPARADALAEEIEHHNRNRRAIQQSLVEDVLARIRGVDDPFLVIAGDEEHGYHRGVVGIVASKVKDEARRPVAICAIQGDRTVGSIRSVPGVHAVRALDSVADLLEKYGGHPVAAGFTVRTADLDVFRQRLGDFVREQTGGQGVPFVREYDVTVPIERVDDALFADFERIGPFGQGNPRPRLLIPGVRPREVLVRGNGRLLKLALDRGASWIDAIWWDQGDLAPAVEGRTLDLLGEVEENFYQGHRRLQVVLLDARIAASSGRA